MKRKNKYLFMVILLITMTLLSYGMITADSYMYKEKKEGQFKIVTSFYPMYVAVLNLTDGASQVVVKNLTENQTGCLHDYQLSPQDMAHLSDADAFVINGGGMESFMEEVAQDYEELPVITAAENVPMLKNEEIGHHHEEDEHEEEEEHSGHEHDHGTYNAHVWMNVEYYMQEIETIRDGLCKLNPENENVYKANAEQYLEKLEVLHEEAKALPKASVEEPVIIFHDSFAYFAENYGFSVCQVVEVEENSALSSGQLANIIEEVKEEDIRLLLAEKQYSVKAAETIAAQTDAKVYVLDSLVTGSGDKDSYLNGMRNNFAVLKEALQ